MFAPARFHVSSLLVPLSLPLLGGSLRAASILDDGSFSLANSGTQTSNSAWVLAVDFPDGASGAAQFQTGFANAQNTGAGGSEAPGTGAGVWFRSFEGNQGGGGDPLANATIAQSVLAPSSGDYRLDFAAGREVNFTAAEFSVTLSSGGTGGSSSVDLLAALIADGNLGGAASGNQGGTPFSILLSGVSAGDLLTVTGAMVDGEDAQIPGGQSGFLDSFSLEFVAPIPEPSRVLLLGAGLFGVLLRWRRRF